MFTLEFDESLALGAKDNDKKGSQFSGLYNVEIKSAYQVVSKRGTKGVKFRVYIPERKKTYEIDTLWIEKADGTPINFQKAKIMKIFGITKANPNDIVQNMENIFGEAKAVPSFKGLLGAEIGMIIQLEQKYKQKEVAGKWIDDKTSDPKPLFKLLEVCNPKTKQTYAEMKSNVPAEEVENILEDLKDILVKNYNTNTTTNTADDLDDGGLGDL